MTIMDEFEFLEMESEHRDQVVELIVSAMDEDEGRWARKTFDFHFECRAKNIDSTRQFYIVLNTNQVIAVAGLHRYRWGPEQNIWLSWFAVRPDHQRKGIGKWLFSQVRETAERQGYRKMFIETYRHATFEKAIRFYQRHGFCQTGEVPGYLPDGSDMLVFQLDIGTSLS